VQRTSVLLLAAMELSDARTSGSHSFLLHEFWDLPERTIENGVELTSDNLQSGVLAQLSAQDIWSVSAPTSKGTYGRCIHVWFSLFLVSKRSGLPRIEISEPGPEQDLLRSLCLQLRNRVPNKGVSFGFSARSESHEIPRLWSPISLLGAGCPESEVISSK
jgi:hypothetical protein